MKLKNNLKQLFLYLCVGGIATLAEWGLFWLFGQVHLHYTLATVLAYTLSTLVNWAAGRLLVFKTSTQPLLRELVQIYLTALAGLGLNLLLMLGLVGGLHLGEMLSKIIATVLVFAFNFLVRKKLIYK